MSSQERKAQTYTLSPETIDKLRKASGWLKGRGHSVSASGLVDDLVSQHLEAVCQGIVSGSIEDLKEQLGKEAVPQPKRTTSSPSITHVGSGESAPYPSKAKLRRFLRIKLSQLPDVVIRAHQYLEENGPCTLNELEKGLSDVPGATAQNLGQHFRTRRQYFAYILDDKDDNQPAPDEPGTRKLVRRWLAVSEIDRKFITQIAEEIYDFLLLKAIEGEKLPHAPVDTWEGAAPKISHLANPVTTEEIVSYVKLRAPADDLPNDLESIPGDTVTSYNHQVTLCLHWLQPKFFWIKETPKGDGLMNPMNIKWTLSGPVATRSVARAREAWGDLSDKQKAYFRKALNEAGVIKPIWPKNPEIKEAYRTKTYWGKGLQDPRVALAAYVMLNEADTNRNTSSVIWEILGSGDYRADIMEAIDFLEDERRVISRDNHRQRGLGRLHSLPDETRESELAFIKAKVGANKEFAAYLKDYRKHQPDVDAARDSQQREGSSIDS